MTTKLCVASCYCTITYYSRMYDVVASCWVCLVRTRYRYRYCTRSYLSSLYDLTVLVAVLCPCSQYDLAGTTITRETKGLSFAPLPVPM